MKKYIAMLIGLEIILFTTNFRPGTFLVGWDNVMPEFNILLNLNRSLFSLWQEYRGLGLIDGMAHSANLIHTLYIAFLNLFLPDSVVRYVYIHLTHLAGGIGFFLLCLKLFPHTNTIRSAPSYAYWEGERTEEIVQNQTYIPAFLGTLFYLFNIGIIQMYYAPLEVFATHFAALPLLAVTTLNATQNTSRKNLLFLFLSALLVTPQAFVPTVFIAYGVIAGFQLLYSLLANVQNAKTKIHIKKTAIIGATLFLANAFWLLPYAYSALTTPQIIAESRINEFSSEEIFYRNQARGNALDTVTLKGFMLDSLEYDQQNSAYFSFMGMWNSYMQNPLVASISILFAVISVTGIVFSIIKRISLLYPFLGAAIVSGFFLANDTPLLAQANDAIRDYVPLIGEAFRFPFTKFITLFAFCLSIFLAYILSCISFKKQAYTYTTYALCFLGIAVLSFPAFQGYFTAPQLRLSIPQYYQETFDYFSDQPHDARVVLMPAETFWNWGYTSWGHRGSGFIWHGIPQALLTRAFDPWSLKNEQFYNELAYAQSIENPELFARVLRKYDVHYLLLDQSILNSLSRQPINYDEINQFLEQVPGLREDKRIDKIVVYKTDTPASSLYTLSEPQTIKAYPAFLTSREDTINSTIGNYVITDQNPDIYTPFPSLSSDKLQSNMEVSIKENSESITFTPKQQEPITIASAQLIVPSYFQDEFLIPVKAKTTDTGVMLEIQNPVITVNDKNYILPTKEIELSTTIQNPTSVQFSDIEHTIQIDSSEMSYLLKSPATTIIVSNGDESESIVLDMTQQELQPTIVSLPDNTIRSFSVSIPKIHSTLSQKNVLDTDTYTLFENPTTTLNYLADPLLKYTKEGTAITFTAQNGSLELAYYKDNLYHQASYLVFINAKYNSGLPINFYIDNTFREKAIIETKLSKETTTNTLVLPRTEQYFQGYGFHIIVKSVGKEVSQATIQSMSIYPAPLETIKRIRVADIASPVFAQESADTTPINYTKQNFMAYTTSAPGNNYLILSQSEADGWNAYRINSNSLLNTLLPFSGEKLEKVTVNNWKNGWKIPGENTQTQDIGILFLPLYIQYIGQFLTIIGFTILGVRYLLSLRKNSI